MLLPIISFLKSFQIEEQLQSFFENPEIENLLKDMQQQQLNNGIRADGSQITPPYTPYTEMLKKAKGQPFDRVTLKDRGDFYESIKSSTTDKFVELYATDKKTNELVEKYGEVLGLTVENVEILKNLFSIHILNILKDGIKHSV